MGFVFIFPFVCLIAYVLWCFFRVVHPKGQRYPNLYYIPLPEAVVASPKPSEPPNPWKLQASEYFVVRPLWAALEYKGFELAQPRLEVLVGVGLQGPEFLSPVEWTHLEEMVDGIGFYDQETEGNLVCRLSRQHPIRLELFNHLVISRVAKGDPADIEQSDLIEFVHQ